MPVKTWAATSPLIDTHRRLDVPRGGPPPLVPLLRITDDQVGGELIHKQQRREARKQRDSVVERINMVEHASCDYRVPRLRRQGIRNLLELASQEAIAVRCSRVDAHDVIATLGELRNESSRIAATHLEHTRRWGRQVTEDEWQKIGNAAHPAFVASCSRGPRALVLPTQRCLPLVYQEQPDWAVHEDTRRVLDARRDAEQRDTADANVRHVIWSGRVPKPRAQVRFLPGKCAQRRDHSPGTIRPDS